MFFLVFFESFGIETKMGREEWKRKAKILKEEEEEEEEEWEGFESGKYS